MNDITPHKIKTGGDPRTLPDYAALRDELNKLTHPARPDVNWRYAEKLCLSLFEQNGVELQTAAWYTLARTQLAGLFGLNEGLTILDALISHQWGALWPQPVHARMEILSSLSQRLQQRMRSLPLNYSDLSQLYRAEQLLTGLGEVLQRLELKHLSQLDTLRTLMHNSAVRLENSDGINSTGSNIQPGVVLPATVMNDATTSTRDFAGGPDEDTPESSAVKWVYVAQPEQQPNVEVLAAVPTPVKKWKSFLAGMCTMLVIGIVAVWGWQFLHRPDPLQTQLAALLLRWFRSLHLSRLNNWICCVSRLRYRRILSPRHSSSLHGWINYLLTGISLTQENLQNRFSRCGRNRLSPWYSSGSNRLISQYFLSIQ